MGKTASCIQLLQILNSGRIYKCSELAYLLETNVRNIIEYKNELSEMGYFIKSIPGRYGGYQLDKNVCLPVLRFTDSEKEVLRIGSNYINSRIDFPRKEEFDYCMNKIFTSISSDDFGKDILIINRYPLIMDEKQINQIYELLYNAIKFKNIVKLTYVSQKKTLREYNYHPYELFMYNNAWFVIGWNEKIGNISYFKLNRIKSIEILDKKFKQWKYYNRNDFLDEFGFKNNGDWIHIEFIAKNHYAKIVKERLYGRNQEVIEIDDNQTLVKVDIRNEEEILTFLLGFGENLKLLSPQRLIDRIINYRQYLINNY